MDQKETMGSEDVQKRSNWWLPIGLVIFLVVIIGGLSLWQKSSAPKEVIKIGAILPLTGQNAIMGQREKEGLELAKNNVNSKQLIKGKSIEIIYEDSKGDVATSVTAYKKLVEQDGVKVVFNTMSGPVLGVAPLAEKDKVINYSISSGSAKITTAGDYTFRINLQPKDETQKMAEYIYSTLKISKIAIFVVNNESGVSYQGVMKADFEALGGTVAYSDTYVAGAADVRSSLTKIKSLGINAVYTTSYPAEKGQILKQADQIGLDAQWFGMFGDEGPELISVAGALAEKNTYTHFYDPQITSSKMKDFQASYLSAYSAAPDSYSVLSYDSLNIVANAVNSCSTYSGSCVKDKLYATQNYQGVVGNVSFDSNGDTRLDIIFKTVRNGQFVKLP